MYVQDIDCCASAWWYYVPKVGFVADRGIIQGNNDVISLYAGRRRDGAFCVKAVLNVIELH